MENDQHSSAGAAIELAKIAALMSPILNIDEVALILKCSVDTVRRISDKDLPVRVGAGRGNMYCRADVDTYISNRPLKRDIRETDDNASSEKPHARKRIAYANDDPKVVRLRARIEAL